jgi:hypothetical protein
MSSYEDKIKEQARRYLQPGERVLAAFVARPRGAMQARTGLAGSIVGGRKVGQQRRAAEEAGLQLASPMALTLTDQRLLVLRISPPIAMGKGGDVKDLVSEAPLTDVDSIDAKRLLVGRVVTVTVRGTSFKLEVGAGENVQGVADGLALAKTGVTK